MAKESQQLVLAFFDSEAAAQQAADELKKWDKSNDDVKAGAVGVIALDAKGKIKEDLLGRRAGGKGAKIGAVLGVIAAIPTGGLSLLGGVVGGAAGGGVLGSFFHRHLGLTDADRERISQELAGGKAAVGVLAEAQEVGAFAQKLQDLGGKPETHDVTDEGLEQAAVAVAAAPVQPQAEAAPAAPADVCKTCNTCKTCNGFFKDHRNHEQHSRRCKDGKPTGQAPAFSVADSGYPTAGFDNL